MRTTSDSAPHRLPAARGGFTAVELLVVIGIMMLLMSIAIPSIIPSLRRGALHNAMNDIESCWRQARYLAMTTSVPNGTNPAHFGIVLSQNAGERPYVALAYDSAGPGVMPNLLRQDQDPANPATYDPAKPPVVKHEFSRHVVIASQLPGGSTTTADRTVTVYAQYQTGVPVSPEDVAAGRGMVAAPTSFGIAASELDPTAPAPASVAPVIRLQTLDYDPSQRGFALGVALYHAGFVSAQAIQE